MVDSQLRDSVGHRDQENDLVFTGVVKEKVRARVVNEVITRGVPTGLVLDDPVKGALDSQYGLDGTVIIQEEIVRRQWNWKSYAELKTATATGVLQEGGVRIDLNLD